jgi:processive 1,2-diacylglycerol beta-glucosyltransferase
MDAITTTTKATSNLVLDLRHNTSCDYHRVVMPFAHVRIRPKSRVFVFNRIPTCGIEALKQMRDAGVKIVADFDDFFELDPWHYLHESFKQGGVAQRMIDAMKLADVVTVTNANLAKAIQRYCDRVEIVPNALPFDQGQFTKSADTTSGSKFVYAGGASHFRDLRLVRNAFDAGDLTVAGYQPGHSEWEKIFNMLPASLRHMHRPLKSYMASYNGHRCAIAPLIKSKFNACKSNLKVLEAGAKGLPIITSSAPPYHNTLDAKAVIYAATSVEWRDQVQRVKTDASYAADAGARLAEHVRKHYHLNKSNEIRRQIIEGL